MDRRAKRAAAPHILKLGMVMASGRASWTGGSSTPQCPQQGIRGPPRHSLDSISSTSLTNRPQACRSSKGSSVHGLPTWK